MRVPESTRCRVALDHWSRERFGVARFSDLQVPGGDLVAAGLADLASGNETVASCLVSIAASRLRREGLPVPPVKLSRPELRLYRLLEQTEGELAHSRYNAYLRRISSFADACRAMRHRAD